MWVTVHMIMFFYKYNLFFNSSNAFGKHLYNVQQ